MYQTIYHDYSQIDLISLFSTSNWNSLSFGQRTQACQEIENRYASENNTVPCLIMTEPMNGGCYGYYIDNTIYLNESMIRDGVFTTTYTDSNGNTQTREIGVLAPNWNTLDTVYHEGTHGVQENQGRMPYTYIDSDQDHDLYRIQGIEKEAYAVGQFRTLDALSQVEKNTGELDASRNDYIASVKADSFEEAVQQAALNYNDPDIENTLASVINDREQDVQPENPSQSYLEIQELCDEYDVQRTSNQQSLSQPQQQSESVTQDTSIDQTEGAQTERSNSNDQVISNSYDVDYDGGQYGSQTISDNYGTDYDDGQYGSQTISDNYGTDYDDGYSSTDTTDYSTDSQSISNDVSNSTDAGMDMD